MEEVLVQMVVRGGVAGDGGEVGTQVVEEVDVIV